MAARRVTVRVVQAREDREKFMPIILELARQIAAQADLNDDLARILSEAAQPAQTKVWSAGGSPYGIATSLKNLRNKGEGVPRAWPWLTVMKPFSPRPPLAV